MAAGSDVDVVQNVVIAAARVGTYDVVHTAPLAIPPDTRALPHCPPFASDGAGLDELIAEARAKLAFPAGFPGSP